jgi:(4S)-4-hydroxy-5-phosphonooxypentane-2,3-dione isomerase
MLVVLVYVHVKPQFIDAFKEATSANAAASIKEAGAAHKETLHYLTWRDTVAPMMAELRTSAKYENIFPADDGWD